MRQTGRVALVLGVGLGLAVSLSAPPAAASPTGREAAARQASAAQPKPRPAKPAAARPAASREQAPLRRTASRLGGPVLQCVVFARNLSGIHLSGNAHTWWYSAAGAFARGQKPEPGAVLNFRASGGMRLGHVSVVSRVVSSREILVDDANWAAPGQRKGQVRRGASVIDVSPNNDWTEVRVANGIGSWGRVYPTFGFIYPRADRTHDGGRIEYAAARPLPGADAAPLARPARTAEAPGGWVWKGGVAVPTEAPAADRPAAAQRQPAAARAVAPAMSAALAAPATPRWTWVDGQAFPLR